MDLILNNLSGLLALLGIPAIIAIHYLQKTGNIVFSSTLFLLPKNLTPTESGSKFSWFRSSVSFWLQFLSILLLTWILVEPRWQKSTSVQRTVLLLDSSPSMLSYLNRVNSLLFPQLDSIANLANSHEWLALSTDTPHTPIYRGKDLEGLKHAIQNWTPSGKSIELESAYRLIRETTEGKSLALYVTDHKVETPPGITLFSIGSPFNTVGFANGWISKENDDYMWHAIIKNYGKTPTTRKWHMVYEGNNLAKQEVKLKPGEMKLIKGIFPLNATHAILKIDKDIFPFDDELPLIIPKSKTLKAFALGSKNLIIFSKRLINALGNGLRVAREEQEADLLLTDTLTSNSYNYHSVIFSKSSKNPLISPKLLSDNHKLVDNLSWKGFIYRSSYPFSLKPTDTPLIWDKNKALVFLREDREKLHLIFNFNPKDSNIGNLPSFIILLKRFFDLTSRYTIAKESNTIACGHKYYVAANPKLENIKLKVTPLSARKAYTKEFAPKKLNSFLSPTLPAIIEVSQGEKSLFLGACSFADIQEADLKKSITINNFATIKPQLIELHYTEDIFRPLWILLLGMLLLLSWRYTKK